MGDRTKNTIRNIFSGLISKVFTLILPFIVRTIVIYKLGSEYIGLGSLFTSILQVLSVTELGFSSAIACTMYEPIAKKDIKRILESIALLKSVYRIIGTIILIAGLILVPFLPILIKDSNNVDVNIYFLYLIHLSNTVISYFGYGYQNTVLSANQRYDMISRVDAIIAIIRGAVQIIVLLCSSNYYLYVITLPVFTIVSNCMINHAVGKLYPELNVRIEFSLMGIRAIWKKIGGIAIGRVSLMCRNSFDSIIISSLIGLNTVAIYSNYYLIYSSISSVLAIILNAMAASVGNSLVLNTVEKNEKDHLKFDFFYEIIVGFCTICLFLLYQPFMSLWVGEKLVFPFLTMTLFCGYFYVNQLAQVRSVYSEAAGLWWHFRYLTIGEMLANLGLNIGFGYLLGVNGIIIATIITAFCGSFLGCSIITYSKLFNKSPKCFFANNFLYFSVTLCGCILGLILFGTYQPQSILELGLNVILVCLYAIAFLLIVYGCIPKTRTFMKNVPFIKKHNKK